MVMPPRIGKDCVVSKATLAPFTAEVASVRLRAVGSSERLALERPAALPGKITSAET